MENLQLHLEALIFTAQHPLPIIDIQQCLEKIFQRTFETTEITEYLQFIQQKYQNQYFPFELTQAASGYQFLTKPEYHPTIATLLNQKTPKKLSTASLETLAIIAYKQPITKTEIEQIRGVNADYSIQKLLEKELIEIVGRSNTPGKPLLYQSSPMFMEYFGIKNIDELPKLKDLQTAPNTTNQIGQNND